MAQWLRWGGGLVGHIFEKIISLENLVLSWREFKRGKMSKSDVQYFAFNLENNLFQLHQELKHKTYHHNPYTSFYITDPKLRHIHKATVRDRVVHQAIFRVIYPIFDKQFIYDSYSCRLNKGTHRAVNRLEVFLRKASHNNSKMVFVLKCDIRKFFDSVGQDILMDLLRRKIYDADVLWLAELIISSFAKKPDRGLPLGNVTSQLFANIYLNELDQFIKHILRVKYYLRYCDDFLILSDNLVWLISLVPKIIYFLNTRLDVSLHPDKVFVRKYRQGIDFLGYIVLPYHRVLRTKTRKRMFKKLSFLTAQPEQFLRALPSYLGMLRHCNYNTIEDKLINM